MGKTGNKKERLIINASQIMGNFKSSFKIVMKESVSHTWIALHRCVEANARLTGETFTSIFSRLEAAFLFKRTEKTEWPDLTQIQEAARQLGRERKLFLDELNALIQQRKREKKYGKRENSGFRLDEIYNKQSHCKIPKVGYWGWRKKRENKD
ncbi:MAG: hypothetical protein P1P88_13000 [Bacteroidales bacterium]|nr:hypothetical protein [Bacteroidales bacterium]